MAFEIQPGPRMTNGIPVQEDLARNGPILIAVMCYFARHFDTKSGLACFVKVPTRLIGFGVKSVEQEQAAKCDSLQKPEGSARKGLRGSVALRSHSEMEKLTTARASSGGTVTTS